MTTFRQTRSTNTYAMSSQQLDHSTKRSDSMAMTTRTIRRSIASLNLSSKKVSALVTYAQGIVKAMTGNPAFPNSAPALAAVTSAINDLQAAETAVLARTRSPGFERSSENAARPTTAAIH